MESAIGIGFLVVLGGFVAYQIFFNKNEVAVKPSVSAPAPVVKEAVVKAPTKTELNKLTKKAIDEKAAEVGITLDARKTKESMIKDFQSEFKKLK